MICLFKDLHGKNLLVGGQAGIHLLLHLFVEGGLQFYSMWWWLQVDGDVLGGILRKLGNCGGLVRFPEHGGVKVFLGLL